MNLGCLDLGCVSVSDKHSAEGILHPESDIKEEDPTATSSKIGKNKLVKETGQSTTNALNKCTSQIKKPPHRKTSPINWFPRKKVDSYLKRKIKMLQEVDGMNLTLDETLGDSNPHYSRVLREKMAAREVANRAMEARRGALVEASWCRILRAARISSKDAEAQLLKAEHSAAEAVEAASAMGVIMYDKPNCPRKGCQIETTSTRGGFSSHTVTASFETAFEVDKEVAAAVKTAFTRLANCPSFNKEEFKELLKKICQNPDMEESNKELSKFSSECESEIRKELDSVSENFGSSSWQLGTRSGVFETKLRKNRRRQSLEKLIKAKLEDMMFERLEGLQEDELSSLATIVATCGLNAALAEVQNIKLHNRSSATDYHSNMGPEFPQRMSEHPMDGDMRRKQVDPEFPCLDKFLVKHMTKLEREIQEAKNSRKESEVHIEASGKSVDKVPSEIIPDLGSILVKHCLKIEKDVEEARKKSGQGFEMKHKTSEGESSTQVLQDSESIVVEQSSKVEEEIGPKRNGERTSNVADGNEVRGNQNRLLSRKKDPMGLPSLDQFLVKHVSRLEKEVQEAKDRRRTEDMKKGASMSNNNSKGLKKKVELIKSAQEDSSSCSDTAPVGKENINLNELHASSGMEQNVMNNDIQETEESLDKILKKSVHRLEREKIQALSVGSSHQVYNKRKKQESGITLDHESLDKVLVKHVPRLEREKMRSQQEEERAKVKGDYRNTHPERDSEGGLDQILVKHKSRLEIEKIAATKKPEEQVRLSVTRKQAREKEIIEAWGGLSLGNLKPHVSRLERDKAAWIKAEEEERRQANEQ